jgi:predicted amidophosphoribosyltransferase
MMRTDVLIRARATLPQTSLGRKDREKNVAGCFKAAFPFDRALSYIILDDVTTTGATLRAAADAFIAAGADRIKLVALAH